MLKQQRVKGYYFLFTLGFLLVFSSGFFAFLAWDGPGYQGSAAALEQPVSPPALSPRGGKANAQGKPAPKPAATLESPETLVPDGTANEPSSLVATPTEEVKPANHQEQQPQRKVLETKPAASEKPSVKVKADSVVMPSGHGVQNENKIATAKEKKAPAIKPKRQSQKVRRTPDVPVDETKVPPEWDWFSTPLRMNMTDHKVEIVSDASPIVPAVPATPQAQSLPEEIAATPHESPDIQESTQKEPETRAEPVVSEPTSSVAPFTSLEESEAYAQRLNNILARLQERREKRAAEASAHALVLPSSRNESKAIEKTGNDAPDKAASADVVVAADKDPKSEAADATEGLPPLPADYPTDDTQK